MRFEPHGYQKYCIDRIISDSRLGLFLDMGLGKTVITLTAVNELIYNRFEVGEVLVIAPKKVAQNTWTTEAQKWEHLKHMRISRILGSRERRIRALNTPADIYVINRENVPWLVEYDRNAWRFDMVVIDELSSFKNGAAQRFKSLCLVRPHIKRIVGLTGTPASNGLIDLWSQIYLLDEGERLGKRITHFRTRFCRSNTHGGHFTTYEIKPDAEEAIKSAISDICISMKAEDYLQLPECVVVDVPVELDARTRKRYREFERDMLLHIDENTLDAGTAAVLSGKLLQFANGAVYDGNRNVVEVHDEKLEALSELTESLNGEHAIVFYSFRHDLERIMKRFEKSALSILNQASAEYGQAVYAQIESAFTAAQRDIQRDIDVWYARFAGNNGITLPEAKKLLNSRELSELKWDIGQYIKYGKQNALDGKWVKQLENASARFHITRLEALQLRTQQALEKAFGNELDAVDGLIRRTVTNDYYRTAFELQKGFGAGFDIGEISTRELDKIVKKPWTADSRTFSDRIWAKKQQMIGDLHNELTRCCIYGRSQKDAIARLEQYVDKNIKNAKYCARRIVVTEQAYFSSRSQYDALKELNVGEYEIDLPTTGCDICREMNGKHFPMSAYEVGSTAPPFHPNCENGGIIPYFDDNEFALPDDKETKPLPEDTSFEEWERKFVKGEGLTNSGRSGIMRVGSERMNDKRISNVYTGIRNEMPLTASDKEFVTKYLTALNVDMDKVVFTDVYRTAYNERFDAYIIGTDVMPLENAKYGVINANQRISIKGTLAHEVIGHREAHIKGWTQYDDVLEEVQASIRAARFAPDLSIQERITLLMDARSRLGRGKRLKDVKFSLHIDER